jgi:glycosyltransferase involved in cell wall biosynthesis
MRSCDVLVDPRTINSFSSCLYEAMTVGLPVVASNVPCNTEALGGGARGILAAAGDAQALAEGIATALLDKEKTARLVDAGRQYAVQAEANFGSDRVAEQLHDLYRDLTSRRLVA